MHPTILSSPHLATPSPAAPPLATAPLAALCFAGGVALLLALPLAADAGWTDAPLETHADDYRVREGYMAAPEDIAADAERAAHGHVIGLTAAHRALLRARPPVASAAGAGSGTGYPQVDIDPHEDTWVADIGVLLRRDADGDGFFGAVDLSIDVDTTDVERDVYAVIELTEPDGTLTLSHVTRTFTVRGNATSDEYRIEIELLDNHLPAYRDVRIEVRDAWSDAWLDEVSAYTYASLRALPLEAERAFGPVDDDDGRRPHGQTDYALGVLLTGSSSSGHATHHRDGDAYVAGYAGAGGPFATLALLALATARRLLARRRRRIA